MKVDTKEVNPAFQSIIQNPKQKVFLDDMQIVQMYELIYYFCTKQADMITRL